MVNYMVMESKEQAMVISIIILSSIVVGLIIGFNLGKNEINKKSIDLDIECENEKDYCVLTDLDFYDRINEDFFKKITDGKGLCGTISLPNDSPHYLTKIHCGDNLDITIE